MNTLEMSPVGTVHSPVTSRRKMPVQGVRGEIEIYQEYAGALDGIRENSHIIVFCWMHKGERNLLKAVPRKSCPDLPARGVFSLRSPARPNPVSFNVVRLLSIHDERFLEVDHLDMVDDTPVLDIKPYQAGWDCIFSATNHDRSEKIRKISDEEFIESLTREAENYHGELCPGLATAVRIALSASRILNTDLRNSDVVFTPGPDPCINDALIGITGARQGNRRLLPLPSQKETGKGELYCISRGPVQIIFRVPCRKTEFDMILKTRDEEIFDIRIKNGGNRKIREI
jgi:tRNA-Thr(GGU) m(6)t(6)A37 methyltransferase TsaA